MRGQLLGSEPVSEASASWQLRLAHLVASVASGGTPARITLLTVVLSLVLHGAAVAGLWFAQTYAPASKDAVVSKVTLVQPPPTPAPTVVPRPTATPVPKKEPPQKKPEKTRKARAREDERIKPEEQPPEPVEVRGGLSDSTALNPSQTAKSPAVALGNSAEVAVDPTKGDLPPPPPVAPGTNSDEVDFSAQAVEEAFADTGADCSGSLPELELTEDAVNAGVSSGKLLIEVIIDEGGKVRNVKLLKGTGYEIDQVAVEAIRSITCVAATSGGEPTVVRKELPYEIVN